MSKKDKALDKGMRKLHEHYNEQYKNEVELLQSAKERALSIFNNNPQGIKMNDLIDLLRQEGFPEYDASYAADWIRTYKARIDWKTGHLNHT